MPTTSSGLTSRPRLFRFLGHVSLPFGLAAIFLMLAGLVYAAGAAVRERQSRPLPSVAAKADVVPEGPLMIVVSVRDQRLSVYAGTDQIARVPISSGTRGHETPKGIFSVIQKERIHFSNLYNNAPMPFMQRLTWSGIALHAGYLPGYPASHGCVRMPADFARKLFGMTKMGARVVVSHSDTSPHHVAHARLAELSSGLMLASADRSAGLMPPMHLGATEAAPVSSFVTSDMAVSSASSLLRKAQAQVKEQAAVIELARAARIETGARHAEALALMATAREAVAAGRAELAKARAKVRRIEADSQVQRSRLRELERSSDADSTTAASAEDKIDATLQALTLEVEAARKDADDIDETLREIVEEASDLDRSRARASLDNEDAALRLKFAEEALKEARRNLSKRQQPISMFVSRKAGKLYVRQGFEPILEVSLLLDSPQLAVGTHVFTAHAAGPGTGNPLQWTAMTIPSAAGIEGQAAPGSGRRKVGGGVLEVAHAPSLLTAGAALERFRMPVDVREQLSELMYPGSSLIISDEPLSQETGKYTDLIVLTQ